MKREVSAPSRWNSDRAGGVAAAIAVAPRPLYPVSRIHLAAISDHVGIWQHARGAEPDPKYGYCTDDVARLLVVDVLHSRQLPASALTMEIARSLKFLEDAFDRAAGRFRNFRGADRGWLDHGGSEDCQARALAGLAAGMAGMPGTKEAERARGLFDFALPAAGSFRAIRPTARAILACDDGCEAGLAAAVMPTMRVLGDRLADAFAETDADTAWPWPEPVLTYENALVPQALIVAGLRLGWVALVERGCAVLDWLVEVQSGENGVFSPVGNRGWWPRTGSRSRFDQQPIDAATMVSAAAAAFAATGRRHYLGAAEQAYGWFLGDNDVGIEIADPANGACYDGLTPVGVNVNQGAESTLMWLTALERIRELRRDSDGVATTSGGPERLCAANTPITNRH
jgi:hypothetical protein